MRNYLMLSMLLLNFSAFAVVYQWVDSNGVVNFSNQAHSGSVPVNLNGAPYSVITVDSSQISNNLANVAATNNNSSTSDSKALAVSDSSIAITSPQDQQTFQNQNTIPVQITMQAQLPAGGVIALYLDGKQISAIVQGNRFSVQNVGRGTHVLQVKLLDASANVLLESKAVTIYVHLPIVHLLKLQDSQP